LWRRWWRSLHQLKGWHYTLRLTLGLAAAEAIAALWQQPKAYWIAVTVVIVVRRGSEPPLVRVVQRFAGTCVGVLIGGSVVGWVPPSWAVVALVAVLSGARPVFRDRNYAAYATVMTPLVVLLLDLGRETSASTMGYRLLDTVIGCGIALVLMLPMTLIAARLARRPRTDEKRNSDGRVG
jgi:uncharacterized membrane protein YccC